MLITVGFFYLTEPYEVTQSSLLTNPALDHQQLGWKIMPKRHHPEDGPLVLMRNAQRIHAVVQSFSVSESQLVQVRISVTGFDSASPLSAEVIGRADIYGRTGEGKFLWLANIGKVKSTGSTGEFTSIARVPDGVNELQIEVESTSNATPFTLLEVSAQAVRLKPYRTVAQPALMTLWLMVILASMAMLWRAGQKLIIAGAAIVLAVLLLIPAPVKVTLQSFVNLGFESADHALLFFVMGLVLFYRSSGGLTMAITFVLATELLQNFTTHREVLLLDVLANLLGLGAAFLICAGFRSISLSHQPS
ncbi:MAG: VanZ family protein [Candidatus Azotimanducaceae bacterium]|jgi:VanZ family protein